MKAKVGDIGYFKTDTCLYLIMGLDNKKRPNSVVVISPGSSTLKVGERITEDYGWTEKFTVIGSINTGLERIIYGL